MKLQCSCGAKYEFEITPDMAQRPVQFVCPACGIDASAFVTELVRQQFGQAPAAAPAPAPAPAPAAPAAPRPAVRVRLHKDEPSQPEAAPAEEEASVAHCTRHAGEIATEKCCVCSKPICPKCMALFGYVCGPHCKAKAEANGIEVPEYRGLKSAVEARMWRKTGLVAGAITLVIAGVLGVWFWYAWFGSVPKVTFSVRFTDLAYSGKSAFAGTNQLVFLHGGHLARYDLKTKQEIWSRELIDDKEIEAKVNQIMKEVQAEIDHATQTNPDHIPRMPQRDRLKEELIESAAAALELRVHGENIWIVSNGKLTRYDWNNGKPEKELTLPPGAADFIVRGDEMLLTEQMEDGQPCVTYIDLMTCQSRRETLNGLPWTNAVAQKSPAPRGTGLAGLPRTPGKDAGKPMDPKKVAEQASHLSYPERIALPVLLSNTRSQERAMDEMDDSPKQGPGGTKLPAAMVSYVPTKEGFMEFSTRVLERKIVAHNAMKAPPAKSALDGNLTANKSTEVANEILNDMQRERGGAVEQQDESRYEVKLKLPGGKEGWKGEVIGPPALYPLATVDVVAANKTIVVLDKQHRKLWQAELNYNVESAGYGAWDPESGYYGKGPCVEHKGGLYIMDQGVLTAFDLASGSVRWRLPSVGIAGVFFDDQDMIYVNSTSAGLDAIKYSRQIDISQKIQPVVFKIDSRTGKTLWREKPGSMIRYVSGKYVYVVQSYLRSKEEQEESGPITGFEAQSYTRIKRLNPKTGREMWEHYEGRGPLDVQFDRNNIRIVFKKEVEVLKFLSL